MPDDVLASLAGNGGVCMVTFVPPFVSQALGDWWFESMDVVSGAGGDPPPVRGPRPGAAGADAAGAARADRRRTWPTTSSTSGTSPASRTSGIGGDYDGSVSFPAGLEDVSGYPRLFEELRSRGWSEDDLVALGSGNVLRALRDMESAAS